MDVGYITDDGAVSTLENTDDPITETSEVSTPVTFSADASPLLCEQALPSETLTATPIPKKKKKKKSKKSNKAKDAVRAGTVNTRSQDDKGDSPQILCISRNKHWRYISSYHGPWLHFPTEILESLFQVNIDPTMYTAPSLSPYLQSSPPVSPSSRFRGFNTFEDHDSPESPRGAISIAYSPSTGKALPPPIDPGVLRAVTKIRRLIDEATDLSVRASSGLSAIELGSMRNVSSYNGTSWAAAQSLGLNPPGTSSAGGRNPSMSANRVHRLRSIAVQKLAQAYKLDEIASSVMVMQGGSVFDDIAERVLKNDPLDADAKYVHFFHEKIPSSHRQLAESTPTTILDELISAYPNQLEYYRTRGIVYTFHENFPLAIKDFTHAVKEARARRKRTKSHHIDSRSSTTKSKKRKGTGGSHPNEQAPSDGSLVPEGYVEGTEGELVILHPSMQPDAPEPLENQLLFLRGAAYLQQAVHMIESVIIELEGVQKPTGVDGADLRLCCLTNARYGGVEIGNPDGPLGSRTGAKMKAYRALLGAKSFQEQVNSLLKKSIRDHEKFLSHFDGGEILPPESEGDIVSQVEFAFQLSEATRPGSHNNQPPTNIPDLPATLIAYHPLLIESHFSALICYLMLADFDTLLNQFAKTAFVADGVQGYPVFLPPRSMGQAEFIEVLERLATGWKNGCQPHSQVGKHGKHRGKARLASSSSPSPSSPRGLPKLITPSISADSNTSTSSTALLAPIPSVPMPTSSSSSSSSVALITKAISGININATTASSSSTTASTTGSSNWALRSSLGAGYNNTTVPNTTTTTTTTTLGSSSSSFLHPDTREGYASSASVSRKSSTYTLNSPTGPSPSCSPSPLQQQQQQQPTTTTTNDDKSTKPEDIDYDYHRIDATHALDCARILLAPVIKRQRERAEQAAAERVAGIKSSMPINIPMHGPRVEIILAWIGALHLPALDGA